MHKDLFVGLNALFLFVRLNALNNFFPVHLLFQLTSADFLIKNFFPSCNSKKVVINYTHINLI